MGTLTSGSVANCYSTCSASGTTAGILLGSSPVSATNSYAVGDVNGAAWGVTDLDGNALTTETYDALVAGKNNEAHPYDNSLTTKYGGKYPLKTISDFSGASASETLELASDSNSKLTKHLTAQYGDWPAIVTLVVND